MATHDVESIFVDILDRVKLTDPINTRKWFDELAVINLENGSLQIGCPDEATTLFLSDSCKKSFTQAAQQITGHLVTVNFKIDNRKKTLKQPLSFGHQLKLHPDYTFENFVVGPSNRLAHASCVAISQAPGDTYNPFFIYGNSGLGKTHLLQAVCHQTQAQFEGFSIEFLSCEEFINKFIRAIEQGNLTGFQNQFRTVDMLIIDDVQFLREREQSQEEFFHTFNALYNNGKQIILSCDRPPAEIPSLEERLISRFNWGLVTRIDPPSHDTRVAIVKKKAHLRDLEISDEIAEYIARKVQANIRELEGALTSIYAVAMTGGKDITMRLAQQVLGGQKEPISRHVSISDIIEAVKSHFNVRLADLQSKKRSQSITEPRQICMYLARNLTNHSLEEIGGHLGGRDHTTVMHACTKIANIKKTDPTMNVLLDQLSKQVTTQIY